MKLSDHVDHIRTMIYGAFNNQFSRLGIGPSKMMDIDRIPAELHSKHDKIAILIRNHTDETGNYQSAREKALDELTFTLFNRLAAIKVMEAHHLFPPIVTKEAQHGDRSFGHKAWLEQHPEGRNKELEGLRDYLKYEFNQLGESIPLFHRDYPYAVLPYVIELNEIVDAFNAVETDSQIDSQIWQSDDVLGWLYESYNNAKKKEHKDSGEKTEYHKVSLQSQVYTPRWVVEFLVNNSLGKLYLEMYPDSEIKNRYKIANVPETRVSEPKPLHLIKMIDPAPGSGNFLLYGFELFYQLYLDQIENYEAGYDENDIPQLIIENNLFGVDLDDRAVQLAQLGLWIKARQKRRSTGKLKFNVVSSDFFLPDFEVVHPVFKEGIKDINQLKIVREIWGDLQQAHKFGSLVKIEEKLSIRLHGLVEQSGYTLFGQQEVEEYERFKTDFLKNLEQAVERFARQQGNAFLADKTHDAITFLKVITQKYDVATANPPYTDSADFGKELKSFVDDNYMKPNKFHSNLYASFIKRCYDLANDNGFISMIHPLTFMYIKSFDGVRDFIISKTKINVLVELGLGGVFENSDVQVDPAMYILEKKKSNMDSLFMDLKKYKNNTKKPTIFKASYTKHLNNEQDEHVYILNQSKFKKIPSFPFIYWISDEFREKIKNLPLSKKAKVISGMKTGNNEATLRFWWELDRRTIRTTINKEGPWIPYAKGGPFKKWAGNVWLCLNWKNDGASIYAQNNYNVIPQDYFSKRGITYGARSAKGVSYRILDKYELFDMVSGGVFVNDEIIDGAIGVLNSKLIYYITNCLNPTSTTQPNDIKRLPFIGYQNSTISKLSKRNYELTYYLDKFSIIEPEFTESPLNNIHMTFKESLQKHITHELFITCIILVNEGIIDEEVFQEYKISSKDVKNVIDYEGQNVGSLPITVEAQTHFLTKIRASEELNMDIIRNHVAYLPNKVYSLEEYDGIQNKFDTLLQGNNNLEEFCDFHQVNPIDVWYWLSKSNIIPKYRMQTLVKEFLFDLVREILLDDDDGIIPLVPNAGEKILLNRIEEKIIEKGFISAQFDTINSLLGQSINKYLKDDFFKELSSHLKLFKRLPPTPFIWHLSSGPEQGFDCYLIIYKWNRDKLMRLRSVYIENRERALVNRQTDLRAKEQLSAAEQTEADKIYRQLKEIDSFKQKIDELLAEGYDPILDDGVGKNIAPLQKKGMLPYEVLNPAQLKKYLNADW